MARLRVYLIGRQYPVGTEDRGQEIRALSGRMRYVSLSTVQSRCTLFFHT